MTTKPIKNGLHKPSTTEAWKTLSKLLPSRDPDFEYWWNLTGIDLANMVEAAGYSIERQYEALLFHHQWIVQYMGPAPRGKTSGGEPFEWPCVLTLEGNPMEYSWKWDQTSGRPEVRYCIEAKNSTTGSSLDPLNQLPTRELLHKLSRNFPGIDLTWTDHFLSTLYSHDLSKYPPVSSSSSSPKSTTTIMLAIELKPLGPRLKVYFIPRLPSLSPPSPLSLYKSSILSLVPHPIPSATSLFHFLTTHPTGTSLTPTMLAVDCVSPLTQSPRLKFYLQSPSTSFSSTRQILTMGGRIPIPESGLQDLRALISAVAGVGADFSEDAELPILAPAGFEDGKEGDEDRTLTLPGFGYYFDVSPTRREAEVPSGIKVFVRLCVNGGDDGEIAEGLAGWMRGNGRGDYVERYEGMVRGLARHRALEEGKGLHTHVSALWLKDREEWEVTSYLAPVTGRRVG